jgi:hypothetical protein
MRSLFGCVSRTNDLVTQIGKPRSRSRWKVVRTLHLCDECLERLPAVQLNDLFLEFVGEQNKTSPS